VGNWTIDQHGPVALLTYSRPPGNFVDPASLFELRDIFEKFAEDIDRVKVVVLTGGLDGFFINYGDISGHLHWLKVGRDGLLHSPEYEAFLDVFLRLEELPQPTIAAIDGLAAGAGSEIALACTMRVGSPRARMQQPEISSGFIPGGGGTVRLPRLVGPGIAAEAILTGRVFEADEAFRVGWINAILPAEGFIDHALRWAERVAQHSGTALIAAKASLRDSLRLPFNDAVKRERDLSLRQGAISEFASGKESRQSKVK
jgi:enoyl-CoA hydratase